jgi:hypothetical protein
MSLGLPETGSHISPIAVASLDVDLVERGMDLNGSDITVGLPEGLEGSMEVLSDGIGAGIPESDALDQVEGEGVVAEGEGVFE